MQIYFEGTDASGKSTVAKRLSKVLENVLVQKFPVLKVPRRDGFEPKLKSKSSYLSGINESLAYFGHQLGFSIFDRGPISEYVYSKLFKRPSEFSFPRFFGNGPDILVVYCWTDYKTYVQRMNKRKEKPTSEKLFVKEQELFHEAMDKFGVTCIEFPTHVPKHSIENNFKCLLLDIFQG